MSIIPFSLSQYVVKAEQGPMGGAQMVLRFPNGYGASVIQNRISYDQDQGLLELAVVHFPDESNETFQIDYKTPITDDVLGWLSSADTLKLCLDIMALKPKQPLQIEAPKE